VEVHSEWQLIKSLDCDQISRECGLRSVKTSCISEMRGSYANIIFKFVKEVLLGVVVVTFVNCQGVEVRGAVEIAVAKTVSVLWVLV
jgi:hypothetical protein